MTTGNAELLARIERLEQQHRSYNSLFLKMMNREAAFRSAVMALIFHAPQGALIEDFSMFLDQAVSELPKTQQQPDLWEPVISAIESDRKPHPAP